MPSTKSVQKAPVYSAKITRFTRDDNERERLLLRSKAKQDGIDEGTLITGDIGDTVPQVERLHHSWEA